MSTMNVSSHIIDDFIGWDRANGIFYPRYQLIYEVWRDAIRHHPFGEKHFLIILIKSIAEIAHLREYPNSITHWQLLSVICQKLIQNKEF